MCGILLITIIKENHLLLLKVRGMSILHWLNQITWLRLLSEWWWTVFVSSLVTYKNSLLVTLHENCYQLLNTVRVILRKTPNFKHMKPFKFLCQIVRLKNCWYKKSIMKICYNLTVQISIIKHNKIFRLQFYISIKPAL